jgi:hypothetical protein
MKSLRKKATSLAAVAMLAFGSMAFVAPSQARADDAVVVCVTGCATGCAFGICVTVCVTVCVGVAVSDSAAA